MSYNHETHIGMVSDNYQQSGQPIPSTSYGGCSKVRANTGPSDVRLQVSRGTNTSFRETGGMSSRTANPYETQSHVSRSRLMMDSAPQFNARGGSRFENMLVDTIYWGDQFCGCRII